jgi:hypothetical protein
MKTLNHFKSWWQSEIIDKGRSLEDKQKLLDEMEAAVDDTNNALTPEMIEFIKAEIANVE